MDALTTIIHPPFWGERGYINGSHIQIALLEMLSRWNLTLPRSLETSFAAPLRGPGKLRLVRDTQTPVPESRCGVFLLQGPQGLHRVDLVPCDGPTPERIPDDENALLEAAVYIPEEQRAQIHGHDISRNLTVVSSLNKRLLQCSLSPQAGRKWFYAQSAFQDLPALLRAGRIEIRVQRLVGSKMARSAVLADGVDIGNVSFIRSNEV
jgi:hypothetical protein